MACKVAGCRFPHSHTTLGHVCGTCGLNGHGQLECGKPGMCQALLIASSGASIPSCTAPGCKHPHLHTLAGHKCTTCQKFHQGECTTTATLQCPQCKDPAASFQRPHRKLFLNGSECPVCLSDSINCILSCGHGICGECADEMAPPAAAAAPSSVLYTDDKFQKLVLTDLPPPILQAVQKGLVSLPAPPPSPLASAYYMGMGCRMYVRVETDQTKITGFLLHSDLMGQYGAGDPDLDHMPFLHRFLKGTIQVYNDAGQ